MSNCTKPQHKGIKSYIPFYNTGPTNILNNDLHKLFKGSFYLVLITNILK